jgi:hypothetical protein
VGLRDTPILLHRASITNGTRIRSEKKWSLRPEKSGQDREEGAEGRLLWLGPRPVYVSKDHNL